jgi:hypothetical protein
MPYLGLEIELDFAIMQEVAEEIEMALTVPSKRMRQSDPSVC